MANHMHTLNQRKMEEEVTGKGSVVNTGLFLWGSHTDTGCDNSSYKPVP